jgi:hypothetical protein
MKGEEDEKCLGTKGFQPVLMSFIEHSASFSLQSRRCLRYTRFTARTLFRQHRM